MKMSGQIFIVARQTDILSVQVKKLLRALVCLRVLLHVLRSMYMWACMNYVAPYATYLSLFLIEHNVYEYTYVFVHICPHTHTHTCTHIHPYTPIHPYTHINRSQNINIIMLYTCTCTYIHTYVCVHVRTCMHKVEDSLVSDCQYIV